MPALPAFWHKLELGRDVSARGAWGVRQCNAAACRLGCTAWHCPALPGTVPPVLHGTALRNAGVVWLEQLLPSECRQQVPPVECCLCRLRCPCTAGIWKKYGLLCAHQVGGRAGGRVGGWAGGRVWGWWMAGWAQVGTAQLCCEPGHGGKPEDAGWQSYGSGH